VAYFSGPPCMKGETTPVNTQMYRRPVDQLEIRPQINTLSNALLASRNAQ